LRDHLPFPLFPFFGQNLFLLKPFELLLLNDAVVGSLDVLVSLGFLAHHWGELEAACQLATVTIVRDTSFCFKLEMLDFAENTTVSVEDTVL
jgi:hypothetical protein